MTTYTSRNSRTLTGYAATLLEYPRWLIERDVDFTNCHQNGAFDESVESCANCRFGDGCRWLRQNSVQTSQQPALDGLMTALKSGVQYVESKNQHPRQCHCRACTWLHEARHFLHIRQV
jgi:hypothetical protein